MFTEDARVRQMLSRGCIAFLGTVEELTTAAPGLKDIPIVREIPSVSPPELMMMPSVREIEIEIDVVLGTAPTSKAPHWVSLVKLRELIEQLQDLTDREACMIQCHVVDTRR